MSVLLGDLRASSRYLTSWMSPAVDEIQFARHLVVRAEQPCAVFLAYAIRSLLRLPVVANAWASGVPRRGSRG